VFGLFAKIEEEVLQCSCGGNIFHLVKIDDVQEIECIGCRIRKVLGGGNCEK